MRPTSVNRGRRHFVCAGILEAATDKVVAVFLDVASTRIRLASKFSAEPKPNLGRQAGKASWQDGTREMGDERTG